MTRPNLATVSLTEHNIPEVQRGVVHVAYIHIGIDPVFCGLHQW